MGSLDSDGAHALGEQLETLEEQLLDDAVLAPEARVDVHGAHAGVCGDATHGERARPFAGEEVAGRIEQCDADVVETADGGGTHVPNLAARRVADVM